MKRAASTASIALGLAAALTFSCGGAQTGAQARSVADAKKRTPEGARVFERQCAGCHGQRGEGGSAPPLMGPSALPMYALGDPAATAGQQPSDEASEPGEPVRQPFRTAEDLHAYVKEWMPLPKDRIGSLKDEDYWAVVNFILIANESAVPPNGVNSGNASTVGIR
jgi:mono/diheme cytochrome c family protein